MKASEIKLTYKRESKGVIITNSNEAHEVFCDFWDLDSIDYYESFVTVFLSRKNEVLGIMKISDGGIDACIVDIRRIFQAALLTNSSSIIVAHNHPSGGTKPSSQDLNLTKEIKEAGNFLKIKLLDHLILTSDSYLSMADEGVI